MKFIVFIFLLTTSIANAQKPLSGFGIFKIGKSTISILDSLPLPIEEYGVHSFFPAYDGSKHLIELNADTTYSEDNKNIDAYCSYCLTARTFYISSLTIGGIDCKDIYLTFLHDTLIEIVIDELQLESGSPSFLGPQTKFLEGKYGQGTDILEYSIEQKKYVKVGEKWIRGNNEMQCGSLYLYNFHIGNKDFKINPFCLFIHDIAKYNKLISCSEKERKREISVYHQAQSKNYSKF